MVISGQPEFTLTTNIDEPIVLYLKLFKNDGEEHFIPFFADKGITEINTSLKHFNYDAVITGSEQQKKLDEYMRVQKRYNNENLDVLEANFIAQTKNDSTAVDSLSKRSDKILKLKYAHTINFALNNADSEIAAYLTLYDIPDANPKYIDSVYNNLSSEVKSSFYGKKLGDEILFSYFNLLIFSIKALPLDSKSLFIVLKCAFLSSILLSLTRAISSSNPAKASSIIASLSFVGF